MDLLTPTQYPYIFSPDFSKYLDIDRKEKVFLIRDTFTQKKLATVPLYVMNCKTEPHVAVASRFKWEDNHTIKYVNLEGIERRIDVSHNEFNEVQFNVVPMFEELYKDHLSKQSHFYFEKHVLPLTDTLQRLQLKYLKYKSALYLDELTEEIPLYRQMFTVDYTVDQYSGRYVADLSFSYLHWSLMEKLQMGMIRVDQIDLEQF